MLNYNTEMIVEPVAFPVNMPKSAMFLSLIQEPGHHP